MGRIRTLRNRLREFSILLPPPLPPPRDEDPRTVDYRQDNRPSSRLDLRWILRATIDLTEIRLSADSVIGLCKTRYTCNDSRLEEVNDIYLYGACHFLAFVLIRILSRH